MPDERAKHCPACGLMSYPPALAGDHHRGGARHAQGKRLCWRAITVSGRPLQRGRRVCRAGRIVGRVRQREVLEEVGIRIKNIRYFGSQPWPFPNSLMIGFTAEYDSGEFALEEAEIAEAGWFAADEFPGLPPKMSIARRLIDWFAEIGGA